MALDRTVGIVGAGRIGRSLATLLAEAAVDVVVGSRSPGAALHDSSWPIVSLARAIACDVVVIAVPHGAIEPMMSDVGRPRAGAVVIDAANAVSAASRDRLRSALDVPHGVWLRDLLPQVRVARAFSHVQDELLVSRAHRQPDTWAVAVAADDPDALAATTELVVRARYVPVVVGGLDDSAVMDPGGVLFPNMFLPATMRDLVDAAEPRVGAR